MRKLVVLNLGRGDLQNGFPFVIAGLQSEGNLQGRQFTGSLPAATELSECYRRWQMLYELLYQARSLNIRRHQPPPIDEEIGIDEADVTCVSEADFFDVSQELQNRIDTWLDSEDFRHIERQLRSRLHPSDEIRFIIQTEDSQLRKLPWYIWRFFRDYRLAEVSLSPLNFEPRTTVRNSAKQVRVLAILGDSTGIDIEADKRLLADLPEAQTVFLVEPQRREVSEQLWDRQGWDILFFAGHSSTQAEGETGQISINPMESLTIAQLRNALTEAIERGLQLAIFNSCDGLGLARQLADLHIPQMIVMREPVPDLVAQEFLKYFLTEFAGGRSFDIAVRKARERLQGIEGEFPGASWLPVIFQNPAQVPPTWLQLCSGSEAEPTISTGRGERGGVAMPEEVTFELPYAEQQPQLLKTDLGSVPDRAPSSIPSGKFAPIRSIWQHRHLLLRASVLATASVMVLRWLGMLQMPELQAFDYLMRRRPYEQRDERLLIVQATPEDIKEQEVKPQQLASLSDHTLTRLFEKLKQYEPIAIGLDIYRDFPVEPAYPELATYLAQEHLFGICKVRDPFAGDTEGVAPPPEIPSERLSFSDAVTDPDGIIRRHLLSMKPTDPTDSCTAKNSLSFLLALYYLDKKGIQWDYTAEQELQIDAPGFEKKVVLRELKSLTGGYPRLDARGRQILLNYRSLPSPKQIAHTVSVGDLLNERIPPNTKSELKHRIVLVGVTSPINTSADYWLTPYSASQRSHEKKIPGLFIQAHMVSQLLSAVLDNRPLLWVWSVWGEALWIWGWSVVGGVLACLLHQPRRLVISTGLALGTLYGVGYLFILQGGWMPLIPSAIVLVLTAGGITLVKFYQSSDRPSSIH